MSNLCNDLPEKVIVKGKKPRAPKKEPVAEQSEASKPAEKSAKKPRAKKQPPTKEEVMKALDESIGQVKVIIEDLKNDQNMLPASVPFKNIPALVADTLKNLEEDLQEIEDHRKELSEQQ